MGNPERRAPEHRVLEHTPGLLALRAELERWETTHYGDPLTAHHEGALGRYLVGLRAHVGMREDRSLGVLMAALALGPRNGALPGAGDLGPLLRAAVETGADAVDLAVAWGCGWSRPVAAGHEWHGRWVAALLSLSWLVGGSINRTVRWLEDRVSGVQDATRGLGAGERAERFTSHAQHLAMELSSGACRCGHGDRGAGPCGRSDHRLASWRPEDCHLQAFVSTAVRGSPSLPVRAGAFAVSMLANLLRDDHLVQVGVAEFHVCHVCNADLVREARRGRGFDLGDVTRGLHDVNGCPDCGTLADPVRTYQVARKNWLVVPSDWGGQYDAVRRHRCACCGGLFAASRDRCPVCHHPVPSGHRLTSVWVRRVGQEARRSSARGEAHGS
jgi:hypothetical protein